MDSTAAFAQLPAPSTGHPGPWERQPAVVPPAQPAVPDPTRSSRPAEAHLLRRPVFDDALSLAGYELILGGPGINDRARADALLDCLAEVPAGVLGAGGLLFVRLPRPFLVGELTFPHLTGTVLEVLEDDLADAAVVAGVTALADAGQRLCLVGTGWSPALRALLPLFRMARVDVARVGTAGLTALAIRLRDLPIALFVEGVSTLGQLEACRRIQAEFLSGTLVSRPPVVADRGIAPSQLACLRLATALVRPDVDLTEVELAVRSDPALTVRVLRAVNSAAAGVRQRVSSIRQAVVLLGSRSLLGTVLAAGLSQTGANTTAEAVEAVLVRARMCELLATTGLVGRPLDGGAAFTVGMIAGLDVLLGCDLSTVIAELPVHEEIEAAVLARSGPLGAVLGDVLVYEACLPPRLVDVVGMRSIFLASLSWAAPLVAAPDII